MGHYIEEIRRYVPDSPQQKADQETILWYTEQFGDQILTRENTIAHITSSGFLMNATLDKVLMVHHNIRDTWAWTGGHADGDADLLSVAVREAMEETGLARVMPLSEEIASIDILCAYGHVRRGVYVSTHLHLSIAYILICDENMPLRVKPDENSAVRWFALDDIDTPLFDCRDVALYRKLASWAQRRCPLA